MTGIPLHAVRRAAQVAWSSLRDRLLELLRGDLVAMWAHGGTTSTADPSHPGDLDTYVIVARRPDPSTAARIDEAHEATAAEHDVEWDAWYVLADDARRPDPPRHAWRDGRRDTSWAIHRTHWLAGRYVRLHGAEPGEIVPTPTWDQLRRELDRELEHVERHVVEGDLDPFEATYALLTGSRILRALEMHDVVTSKHAAGTWALEHLAERWHAALRAALRAHVGRAAAGDGDLLAAEMAPFVAHVRGLLPPGSDREADALPRWSGY